MLWVKSLHIVFLASGLAGLNRRGHAWYRWLNEAPIFLMLATVVPVVVKSF